MLNICFVPKGVIIRTPQDVSAMADSKNNHMFRHWVELGLMILLSRQTAEERESGRTIERNGIGCDKVHGKYIAYTGGYVAACLHGGKQFGTIITDDYPQHKIPEGYKPETWFEKATRTVVKHRKQIFEYLQTVPTQEAMKNELRITAERESIRFRLANPTAVVPPIAGHLN